VKALWIRHSRWPWDGVWKTTTIQPFSNLEKIVRRISILHQLEEVKTAPLSGEVLTEELWRKREWKNKKNHQLYHHPW
jgi:hypothetical protein